MKLNSSLFLILLAVLIWGATAPIMKLTLREVPVFSLAFIRMALASLILAPFIYKNLKIKSIDLSQFIWAALTGVTLNLSLFFIALKLTLAINASILTAAVPILTILIAHIYLKEKLSPRLIAASLLALVGIFIIIGKPTISTLPQVIGNILLLASSLAWVAHEIIAKKLLKVYEPTVVTFYSMAIGGLTFLPLFVWEYLKNPSWTSHVSISGLLGLLYGIFFASALAYWAWQKGLSKLPAGEASFFFYLDPISGAILSIILLGEKLTQSLIIGSILITVSVFFAETTRKNHPLYNK